MIEVDGVAYAGNIYQEDYDRELGRPYQIETEAYPFGVRANLPAAWNAWKSSEQLALEN